MTRRFPWMDMFVAVGTSPTTRCSGCLWKYLYIYIYILYSHSLARNTIVGDAFSTMKWMIMIIIIMIIISSVFIVMIYNIALCGLQWGSGYMHDNYTIYTCKWKAWADDDDQTAKRRWRAQRPVFKNSLFPCTVIVCGMPLSIHNEQYTGARTR